MFKSRPSFVIVSIGFLSIVGSWVLSGILFDMGTLGFVGVIYLLTGLTYEVHDSPNLREAIGIAVISALIPVIFRLQTLLMKTVNLSVPEFTYVLFEPPVLVPLVVAFMPPFGLATKFSRKVIILVTVAIPFIVGFIRVGNSGFGLLFNGLFYTILFFIGFVAGLPLYFYIQVQDRRDALHR